MSKSANGKAGFNLLIASKENKGRAGEQLNAMAPVKQRSQNKRKDRSNSIKSPRILSSIQNQKANLHDTQTNDVEVSMQ